VEELRPGEQGELTEQDWAELIDGEHEPFGPVGHSLEWRPKDRHVTFRDGDGRLVGAAGVLVATVQAGGEELPVVGVGSVIVTRTQRGRGLMPTLFERVRRLADDLGPDRAMLFCAPELVSLYERFGFVRIEAPVWADQPEGRIEMPEPSMWRPLRGGVSWPPGRVEVVGLPF
jgi:predicted GNAT family N-acyltransferase